MVVVVVVAASVATRGAPALRGLGRDMKDERRGGELRAKG